MFLYELAIALDKRSPELTEAAAQLGLGELAPATDLDAHQAAALRAHFSGGRLPPPLAPLAPGPRIASDGPPPLPAVATGPLVAEPPPLFGGPVPPPPPIVGGPPSGASAPPPPPPPPPQGAAPAAPASWGPPTAPPAWGPPTASAARPTPPDAEQGRAGPYFAYPESPTAEVVDSPLGLTDTILPPPPPPRPAGPIAPGSSSTGGIGTGQKVAIGIAAVLVVGLFGFMIANTGPDKARQQDIASKEAALEAELNATTLPPATTTTAVAAPTTTTPPSSDVYAPVDLDKFCRGGVAVSTFELRLVAAMGDGDFAELSGLVRDRRATWNDDVATMAAGAAPILVNDIELYRGGYDEFFDAIESSSSLEETYGKLDRMELAKSGNAGQEFATQVAYECQ